MLQSAEKNPYPVAILHGSVIPRRLLPRNLSFFSRAQTAERFLGNRRPRMTEIIEMEKIHKRTKPRRIPNETASVRLPAPSFPRMDAT